MSIVDGSLVDADFNAAADIIRSKLAQDALSRGYRIPLSRFRVFNAMETNLPAAGLVDDLGHVGGTHGTAPPILAGEITANDSKTCEARVTFQLPSEYEAGETVTLRVTSRTTNVGQVGSTVDAEVFSNDDDGTVTDVATTTGAFTLTTSFVDRDFVITPGGLSPGDELDIRLTTVADNTGGGGTNGLVEISVVELLLDIRG